jgi:putative transcriptional regulator
MKKMKCQLPILINRYNNHAFEAGQERLTQASLSQKTGIATSTVSRLFNNTARRYDASTVEVLCHFFNCGVGDLLALSDDEVKSK